jgi:hypothetical protein
MIGVATGTTTPALSLTDNSITSAKLLDNTIASLKLLDNTIASTKLLDNTIASGKILDNTIAGSKLNANISIATLGLINGKIAFIDNVSGPTDVQMHGQWNLVNEAITVLLPTAVGGMHGCIQDTGAAHDIIVDVQGTDTMTLVGVEGAGGVGITNAAGASTGDYICVLATGTNKWTATFSRGTWSQ